MLGAGRGFLRVSFDLQRRVLKPKAEARDLIRIEDIGGSVRKLWTQSFASRLLDFTSVPCAKAGSLGAKPERKQQLAPPDPFIANDG